MVPSSNDPTYLKIANQAIYKSMSDADPQAIYVMQGWLFVNDPGFWGPSQVQAFLSGVPDQSMIILDLFTDVTPEWNHHQSYYGKPWIWNMLLIFGGRRALYGNMTRISTGPIQDMAAPGSTMSVSCTSNRGFSSSLDAYTLTRCRASALHRRQLKWCQSSLTCFSRYVLSSPLYVFLIKHVLRTDDVAHPKL
jgi:hypothetical protein